MNGIARTVGRGPDLVLIPGWAFSAAALAPWAERLGARWRVHLAELPGHGEAADADFGLQEMAAAIAERVSAPAVWMGWSLGGMVALAAACGKCDVQALALVAATPRFTHGPDWPHGLSARELAAMRVALAEDAPATVRRFLSLLASRGEGSRQAVAALRGGAGGGVRGLAAGLRLLAETDLRPALPGIAAPALWLGGDADPLVPAAAPREAAAAMPAGRHVTIEGAGHLAFATHGAAVDAALGEWLGEL